MGKSVDAFKGRRFAAGGFLRAVPWPPRFPVRFEDVERTPTNRVILADQTIASRWTRRYAPGLEKRVRPSLWRTNGAQWMDKIYRYRSVDSCRVMTDFMLNARPDAADAHSFLWKAPKQQHVVRPATLEVNNSSVHPSQTKSIGKLDPPLCLAHPRQGKYLNNIVRIIVGSCGSFGQVLASSP